jgi:hypothetical protein
MMSVSREISRQSPSPPMLRMPQQPRLYTPTPDGFERCMRAWVRLPADDVTTPGAGGASAPPEEPGAQDHTGGIAPTREGYRRRRRRGLDA